tara:strand:+ start:1522 stop:1962 length:441 start_codon:yes stop_codon:yes gene_type:complete
MIYIEIGHDGTLGGTRSPKPVEIKLSDGTDLGRPAGGWQDRQLAACGLFPVAPVEKPADTATATHTRTIELATPGDPTTATTVWTPVNFTKAELDATTATATEETARNERLARIDELAAGNTLETSALIKTAIQDLARITITEPKL